MPAKYINSDFWICIWAFKGLKLITASHWLKAIKGSAHTFQINISPDCDLSKFKWRKKGKWIFTSHVNTGANPSLAWTSINCSADMLAHDPLDPKQGRARAEVRLCSPWVTHSHSPLTQGCFPSTLIISSCINPLFFFSRKPFLPVDGQNQAKWM